MNVSLRRTGLLSVLIALFFLSGCSNTIDSWEHEANNEQYAYGAKPSLSHSLGYAISIHEVGAFFINGSYQLCYFDYEAEEQYILCSSPNCTHISSSCVAYAGGSATGFAMYGGNGYYIRQRSDSNEWEIVEVDISSQTTRIVCVFGDAGDEINDWIIHTIGDVYYHGGKAWLSLGLFYNAAEETGWSDNGYQLIAVDLNSGEVTELTEPLMITRDVDLLTYSYFGEEYVGFYQLYYPTPLLSAKDYIDQFGNSVMENGSYNDYLDNYFDNEERNARYQLVQLNTMDTITISDDVYTEPQGFAWEKNGKVVMWQYDSENRNERFIEVDLSNREYDEVMLISNGGRLAWWQGAGGSSCLYNGDSVLYLHYIDNNRYEIGKYSINTGGSIRLFEIPRDDLFQIIGQTTDKLVGLVDDNSQYAWIYKSDYENGELSALHRFSIR